LPAGWCLLRDHAGGCRLGGPGGRLWRPDAWHLTWRWTLRLTLALALRWALWLPLRWALRLTVAAWRSLRLIPGRRLTGLLGRAAHRLGRMLSRMLGWMLPRRVPRCLSGLRSIRRRGMRRLGVLRLDIRGRRSQSRNLSHGASVKGVRLRNVRFRRGAAGALRRLLATVDGILRVRWPLSSVCRALRAVLLLAAALHVVLLRAGTRRRRVTFLCRRPHAPA
jgi:hypothetical protein